MIVSRVAPASHKYCSNGNEADKPWNNNTLLIQFITFPGFAGLSIWSGKFLVGTYEDNRRG